MARTCTARVLDILCARYTVRRYEYISPEASPRSTHRWELRPTRHEGAYTRVRGYRVPPFHRARWGTAQPGARAPTLNAVVFNAHTNDRHMFSRGTSKRMYTPISSAYEIDVATNVVAHSPLPPLAQRVTGLDEWV